MKPNEYPMKDPYFSWDFPCETTPRVFEKIVSQDVADAEPESLAEDDEKELSVVHPARCRKRFPWDYPLVN